MVLQREAGTELQSRLHLPVKLSMAVEGLRGTLTITACVDPSASRLLIRRRCFIDSGQERLFADNLMSIPDAGSCRRNTKKLYVNGKDF
ncbi:MAG: hypothetical protein ACM337_04895 [Syntrophaceae bacterium]